MQRGISGNLLILSLTSASGMLTAKLRDNNGQVLSAILISRGMWIFPPDVPHPTTVFKFRNFDIWS